ncbi:ead/Ea22-like family protein [Salmonella enterica subsp. enterica serovar Ramatgan]|nr:ead/Ea22-like family protein [Salmonella enterica subsp. enterica serovar Mikawasima]ECE1802485.1 ead/Ea22-like family protein [Salmonella enterica]EDA7405068.1 ead/Ea22-like family protein [Salmonella enterica subsp. enterica serovar Sandiego]EDV4178439.1 ead/Ea22-like family protein [Salmonella enterica subsp. enterica serovar Ramatgan]EHK2054155.1 ead/Ea22-like family protein [Salmonella enterica subsp. enterica serovar Richmond]
MNIDKRALREVAEKATKGPWKVFSDIDTKTFSIHTPRDKRCENVIKWGGFDCQPNAEANAEFIAAFNPKVALALLDELDHYKSREERVTKLVMDNSTSWDALYKKLEAAEKRIAEQSAIVAAAEKLVRCKGRYHSELNYRALAKLFGVVTPDLPPLEHENVHYADAAEVEITALRQRIQELEAKLETADRLQDGAFRDGLKAGFSYGQTDDQSGFMQCMSAYSPRAGIGVKQQQDSVDSDVGSRSQPGMVVAVHIDAGDFVKVKGQVFEVEETDFDDHDVTLWFVGGNALKCSAGCPVEVVSAPVAAGIKVKES